MTEEEKHFLIDTVVVMNQLGEISRFSTDIYNFQTENRFALNFKPGGQYYQKV